MQQKSKWVFDFSHSRIGFSVRHFGITETEGVFKIFDGNILTEKADFSDLAIDLTIEANSYVLHQCSFDLEFTGIVPRDPFGNTKAGFLLTGKINRKDWGINWNAALDHGGVAVADLVKISCPIQLLKMAV